MNNDTNITFNGLLNYLNLWANFKPFILNSVEDIVQKLNEHEIDNPWSIGEEFVTDNNSKVKHLFCGKYLTYKGVYIVYIGLNPNMVHFYNTYEDNMVNYNSEMQECFLAVDIVMSYTLDGNKYMLDPRKENSPDDDLEKFNYYKIDINDIKNNNFVETVVKIINKHLDKSKIKNIRKQE